MNAPNLKLSTLLSQQFNRRQMLAMLFAEQNNPYPQDTAFYQPDCHPEIHIDAYWMMIEDLTPEQRQQYQLDPEVHLCLWLTDRNDLLISLFRDGGVYQHPEQALQMVKVDQLPDQSIVMFESLDQLMGEIIDPHLPSYMICKIWVHAQLLHQRDFLQYAHRDPAERHGFLIDMLEWALAKLQTIKRQNPPKTSRCQLQALLEKLLVDLEPVQLVKMMQGQTPVLVEMQQDAGLSFESDLNALCSFNLFTQPASNLSSLADCALPKDCHLGVFVNSEGLLFACLYQYNPSGKQLHGQPVLLLTVRSHGLQFFAQAQDFIIQHLQPESELNIHLFSILASNYLSNYSRHFTLSTLIPPEMDYYLHHATMRICRQIHNKPKLLQPLIQLREQWEQDTQIDLASLSQQLQQQMLEQPVQLGEQNDGTVEAPMLTFTMVPHERITHPDFPFAVLDLGAYLLADGRIMLSLIDEIDACTAQENLCFSEPIQLLKTTPEAIQLIELLFDDPSPIMQRVKCRDLKLHAFIFNQMADLERIGRYPLEQWMEALKELCSQHQLNYCIYE